MRLPSGVRPAARARRAAPEAGAVPAPTSAQTRLSYLDRVTHTDHASAQDLHSQAALMDESFQRLRVADLREIVARLAQTDASEPHFADAELQADKVVQSDAFAFPLPFPLAISR